MIVWRDEPCDRTEGHKGLAEVFQERYGMSLADWSKIAAKYDGGDCFYWLGYVDMEAGFKRVEVKNGCDGDEIKELS